MASHRRASAVIAVALAAYEIPRRIWPRMVVVDALVLSVSHSLRVIKLLSEMTPWHIGSKDS